MECILYSISKVKLRIVPSVLKEPWAFFMLWPLSWGSLGQAFLTLATHGNHRGSFRSNLSEILIWLVWGSAGYQDFVKVPGDSAEQLMLRATDTDAGSSLCYSVDSHTHSLSLFALNPCQFLIMHLRKWLVELSSRLLHLFLINVINLVWVHCCKVKSRPWASYWLTALFLALSLLHASGIVM